MADIRDDARDLFTAVTGAAPIGLWSAPGRVTLRDGTAIPIDRRTVVAAGGRADDVVRLISAVAGEAVEVSLAELDDVAGRAGWADEILAAVLALREEGADLGAVPGVDLAVDSTVPEGVGLGAGRATRDAVLPALRELWRLPAPPDAAEPDAELGDDEELVVIAAGAEGDGDPVLALAVETARESGASATHPIEDGSLLVVVPRDAGSRLRVAIDGAFAEHGWGSPELFGVRPSLGPRRDS